MSAYMFPVSLTEHGGHRVTEHHWRQLGILFRLMGLAQRRVLIENTTSSRGAAVKPIQRRHIENYTNADPARGAGEVNALGLDVSAAAAE